MTHFLEFVGSVIASAAVCTLLLAAVARQLAGITKNIVYGVEKTRQA